MSSVTVITMVLFFWGWTGIWENHIMATKSSFYFFFFFWLTSRKHTMLIKSEFKDWTSTILLLRFKTINHHLPWSQEKNIRINHWSLTQVVRDWKGDPKGLAMEGSLVIKKKKMRLGRGWGRFRVSVIVGNH